MIKLSRKYKIDFPEASGKYWLVIWIGKIHYDNNEKKCHIIFINKKEPNDSFENSTELQYACKTISTYLLEFQMGTLYSIEQEKIIEYKLTNHDYYNCFIKDKLIPSTKTFPLSESKNFPIKISDNGSLRYYIFYCRRLNRKILVSPYVIMHYLIFTTTKMIKRVLNGDILRGIELKFNKEDNSIYATYDVNLYKKNEAETIIILLLLKDKVGIKFLNSIYSSLIHEFSKKKVNRKLEQAYPKLDFGFKNFNITFQGKEYSVNDQNYILAYKIKSMKIDKSEYLVDEINIIPKHEKNSTKDKKNHDQIDVKTPIPIKISEVIPHNLNNQIANSHTPQNAELITNQISIGGIKVNFLERDTQLNSYRNSHFPNEKEIDSLVRDLNTLTNDSDRFREELIRSTIFEKISNYEYFKMTFELVEKHNVKVNFDPLRIGKFNYPMSIDSHKISLIEINYRDCYLYFIEFGFGLIGVFNKKDLTSISMEYLRLYIYKFLSETETKDTRKILWTSIYRKRKFYETEFNINIQQGIEHSRKNIDLNTSLIKTAKRIYSKRIIPTCT